jgi:hypothetical protein
MLQELLHERRDDEVVSLVKLLVARNTELELRLAQQMAALRNNEGVSKEQLLLVLDELDEAADEPRAQADEELATCERSVA